MPFRDWPALDHLDCMTDTTGLIQHAIYDLPATRQRLLHG